MMSSFIARCVSIGIFFLSVSLSGCAYQHYMHQEEARRGDLTDQLALEQAKTIQLAAAKRSLDEEIGKLNVQIEELRDEIAKYNEDVSKLKRKVDKANNGNAQIQKCELQLKRLKEQVYEKQKAVASKRKEVEQLTLQGNF